MGKDKVLRPASSEVKAMIVEASRIDSGLRAMQDTDKKHRTALQQAAEALYNDRIRSALEEMDIEHINRGKQGIRVSLLRNNGITNIYSLSQKSFQELSKIDGLGEQSVWKIQDTVKQITENTKETTRIRINAENPKKVDDDLIRALYIRIHAKVARERGKALFGRRLPGWLLI